MKIVTFLLIFSLNFYASTCLADAIQEIYPPKPVRPLKLKDMHGNWRSLSDYKEQVVLVNFWGSWCRSCVEEMPALQRISRQFSSSGLIVLAVNVNQSNTAIKRFLAAMSLDLMVLKDSNGAIAKDWQVNFYPTSFIIDKHQRIRYLGVGGVDWDNPSISLIIENLLK